MGHSMAKVERILIVGGGIAGLTAAIALRQHGFSPELIEREPAWRAAGAGIALQPNAMRLLRAFSVGLAVERAGAPLQRFKYCTSQGEVLAEIDLAELWKDVGRGAGVERTKLQEALLGELKGAHCRLGAWITTLDQKNDFVSVRFNDGRSEDYDLIIGADGIDSSVRSLALSDAAPSYTGQMGWRSLAPIRHDTPDEVQFWLGDGCFFGLFPVSNPDAPRSEVGGCECPERAGEGLTPSLRGLAIFSFPAVFLTSSGPPNRWTLTAQVRATERRESL
jgi:2-polyprenyl-6-methoxyphenol hydroxylase-like FAD-dependent oxidoreductase